MLPSDLDVGLAKATPEGWGRLVTRGAWRATSHLTLILSSALDAIRSGSGLIVTAPPRHGKSQALARVLAGWVLGVWPGKRVVVASHSATLATVHSRQARRDYEEWAPTVFGQRVDPRSHAVDRWQIEGCAGGYRAVGIGSSLTGEGADLMCVDDYAADAEAALSKVQRESTWDWWESVASTRLEPNAAAIVFATRWHSDDLIGRLLDRERGRWSVLRLPALAEHGDPLGRSVGDALWPERYPRDVLEATKARRGVFWWSAMYQGSPVPEGGGILKPAWWADCRYHVENDRVICQDGWTQPVRDLFKFLVVDTALTEKQGSDYSVVLVCGLAGTGRLFLLDMDRRRMDGPDLVPAVKSKMAAWGAVAAWVERSTASLTQISLLKRAGVPVREYGKAGEVELKIPTGGGSDPKVPTYYAASTIVEAKRMWLPRASTWTADLEAELGTVPYSVTGHDDAAEAACVACLLADHLGGRRGLVADYVPPDLLLPPDPRTGVVHRVAGEVNHSPAPW